MKKIKIMLLSLLILAVAGGTMASKFMLSFCTIPPDNDGNCPTTPSKCTLVTNKKLTTSIGDVVCYTTDLGLFGDCTGVMGANSCVTKVTITSD